MKDNKNDVNIKDIPIDLKVRFRSDCTREMSAYTAIKEHKRKAAAFIASAVSLYTILDELSCMGVSVLPDGTKLGPTKLEEFIQQIREDLITHKVTISEAQVKYKMFFGAIAAETNQSDIIEKPTETVDDDFTEDMLADAVAGLAAFHHK